MDTFSLIASLLTLVLVGLSVLLHFEALNLLNRGVYRLSSKRLALVTTMFGLLLAHTVEIALFATGYWLATQMAYGGFMPPLADWMDAMYYSAMVYTTVGFGDLIPIGPMRIVTSGEAVTGLSLITWSASFAFLQMQRLWDSD